MTHRPSGHQPKPPAFDAVRRLEHQSVFKRPGAELRLSERHTEGAGGRWILPQLKVRATLCPLRPATTDAG
jgi:hypothetical protein